MSISPIGGIQSAPVQAMDIETVLLAVQSQRAQALENQLRGQLDAVQDKNNQIAATNQTMADKNGTLVNIDKSRIDNAVKIGQNEATIKELTLMKDQLGQVAGRDANGWTGLSWGWAGDDKTKSGEMLQRVRAAGLTDSGGPAPRDVDRNGTMDAHASTVRGWMTQIDAKIASLQTQNATIKTETGKLDIQEKEVKAEIDGLKRHIDGLTNSQQMDMLRLQSLSNKRNEAFDIMTNFIKKMQENRSSIIGNLR